MVETREYTAENHLEVQEALPPEESLFDHYSVENEADFLRKIGHLSVEERRFYVRENVLGFLGEYAGLIPYKKISYVLKDGGFDYAGISMRTMYETVLNNTEAGSREWSETYGMLQVEEQLANQDYSNVATVLSPPKIADYSFAFHFVKGTYDSQLGGTPINEYILRYPERMNGVENSRKVARALAKNTFNENDFQTTNDFLLNPFVSYESNPEKELQTLLHATGIDSELIHTSKEFEKVVGRQLSSWIDRYFMEISTLSRLSPDVLSYHKQKAATEMLLGAIYNKARLIKETIDQGYAEGLSFNLNTAFDFLLTQDHSSLETIQQYANAKPLTVKGGNCPIVKRKGGLDTGYMSLGDIFNDLLNGQTLDSIIKQEYFKCPRCEYQADGPVGNKCPGCGLTKQQAAEEGIETC